MRDFKIILPDESGNWNMDIDIINGYPTYVPNDGNTQDQRAAVAAYMVRGSVPGKPDLGINWGGLYNADKETLITIDNEIKQAIQEYAGTSNSPNNNYIPTYEQTEEGIHIGIYRGQ